MNLVSFQGEAVQEIRAGDIVAAPFEHDSQWYRTEVVALEEDSVDLYYRDFGDSSFVNKNSIRILKYGTIDQLRCV